MSFLKNKAIQSVGALFFACCLSAFLKYEVMWDFVNYHYYNGFAFLNGRLGYDVAPASILTFFNPLLDVVTYTLTRMLNEHVTLYHFVMGVPYGVCLFFAFQIQKMFFNTATPKGKTQTAAALAICATGFATFSQIGTSSHELTLAVFVLSAFFVIVKAVFVSETPDGKPFFWAGVLLGAATGLKLTAGLYCVSIGMTVLIFWRMLPAPKKQVVLLILGGMAGFLITNGFWMVVLQQHFQNPVFPLFNGFFQSPYFPAENFRDAVYLESRTPLQTILLPFILIFHMRENFVAGTDFSEGRFAIAYIAALCFGIRFLYGVVAKKPLNISKRDAFLFVWAGVTYGIWLFGSSVIRYAVPLEMLLSIVIVKALSVLPVTKKMLINAVCLSMQLILFVILVTEPVLTAPWGTRADSDYLADFEEINVPDGTQILLYGNPLAALTVPAALQSRVRVLGYTLPSGRFNRSWDFANRSALGRERRRAIEEHTGGRIAFVKIDFMYLMNPDAPLKEMQCRRLERRFAPESARSAHFPDTLFCWSKDLVPRFGTGKKISELMHIKL